MKSLTYLALCFILLAWAGTATGTTIYVPADYPTIQAAINAANNGDEIEVAPGTYTENINFTGKAVRLYSSSGDPTNTTIHGTGNGSVVTCNHNESSTTKLEGLTITGGHGTTYYIGGGMSNTNSSPTVINCTFSGNLADFYAGAMGNWSHSSPTVTNCTFSGNSAKSGGAMVNGFGSHPTVTGCAFDNNLATDGGGGMYTSGDSTSIVADCTFTRNSAGSGFGGGMIASRGDTVTNCTFSGNSADAGGGMSTSGSPTVTNCTFSGNSASYGGGMYNPLYSSPTVANCSFSGNSAGIRGAGMFNQLYSSPTVTNCTFGGNSADYNGGGMYNDSYSSPTVTNCILWRNSGGEIYSVPGATATVTYSDVQGGFAGTGNINVDPLFVGGGDLHLQAGSLCIDAGDNTAISGIDTDLDGKARIFNGTVDMGAYESEYTSNTPPVITRIEGPLGPVQVNTAVAMNAPFTDPDAGDSHTALWDWGDGACSTGVVDEGMKRASGSHTYSAPGVYVVMLTLEDKACACDLDGFEYVVVYDPAAGFVTGGGWINSPPGAYVSDPALTGKATFGFVSKYLKGATVPTGNTEFVFKAGNLTFHSSRYDWLVVNQGGSNAQFKGSGTINGSGAYKFMLWASNEPDTFRIRIWTEDGSGNETDVYDNGTNQVLGGGSIVIHTK